MRRNAEAYAVTEVREKSGNLMLSVFLHWPREPGRSAMALFVVGGDDATWPGWNLISQFISTHVQRGFPG
jgi:hypothetical protein